MVLLLRKEAMHKTKTDIGIPARVIRYREKDSLGMEKNNVRC